MSSVVNVPGIAFDFPGKRLVIPPLALGALEQLRARLTAVKGGSVDPETIETIIDAAHAALKRNYPELTREEVATQLLDVGNMYDVFQAVMDVGGLRRKALEATPGEAPAPAPAPPPSTGASSTQT